MKVCISSIVSGRFDVLRAMHSTDSQVTCAQIKNFAKPSALLRSWTCLSSIHKNRPVDARALRASGVTDISEDFSPSPERGARNPPITTEKPSLRLDGSGSGCLSVFSFPCHVRCSLRYTIKSFESLYCDPRSEQYNLGREYSIASPHDSPPQRSRRSLGLEHSCAQMSNRTTQL